MTRVKRDATRSRGWIAAACTTVIVLCGLLMGCSDSSADADPSAGTDAAGVDTGGVDTLDTGSTDAGGGMTIGAAGGTITLPDGVELTVPAGALSEDTTIGVSRLSDAVAAALPALPDAMTLVTGVYALTPHGTTFSTPVTLELPLPPGTRDPSPWRLDDETDTTWDAVGFSAEGERLVAELSSFSIITVGDLTFFDLTGVWEGNWEGSALHRDMCFNFAMASIPPVLNRDGGVDYIGSACADNDDPNSGRDCDDCLIGSSTPSAPTNGLSWVFRVQTPDAGFIFDAYFNPVAGVPDQIAGVLVGGDCEGIDECGSRDFPIVLTRTASSGTCPGAGSCD